MSRFCNCILALLVFAAVGLGQDVEPRKIPPKVDQSGDPLPTGAVARLGSIRFRHPGAVHFVGYSGDGKRVVTASGDTLHFWDARTGKELRQLHIKAAPQRQRFRSSPSVLLSGDGKTIVLGAFDGDCTVVDVASGKTLRTFTVRPEAQGRFRGDALLSADGRLLVIVENNRFRGGSQISVWDTTTGKVLRQLNSKNKGGSFSAAAFAADGKTLLALESQEFEKKGEPAKPQMRFFDVHTGQEIRSMASPVDFPSVLAFGADDKTLIIHDRQSNVLVYNLGTNKEERRFSAKQGTVRGTLLSPDKKTLFIAGFKEITQFDIQSGKSLRDFPLKPDLNEEILGPFERSGRLVMALSPDGNTLAVPALVTIAFWNVQSGKEILYAEGHRDRIDSLSFAPDGKRLLTGAADSRLCLWDLARGQRLRDFVSEPLPPDKFGFGRERISLFRVRGMFSPDGKSIAGLWWGGKLHIFDAASGKLREQLGGSVGQTGFAFSPNGKFVAVTGPDGLVRLFTDGREIRTFGAPMAEGQRFGPDFEQSIFSTAFTPDSRTLIGASFLVEPNGLQVQIKHWEMASAKERRHFQTRMDIGRGGVEFDAITSALDSFIVGFVFSPDGKTVAEAGFSNIKLRNVRNGREIRSFGGKQIAAATTLFSPDGAVLIAGKHDGSIRLWNLSSGIVLGDFPAHSGAVTALAFSADGKWLASGARDGSVLIWDWEYLRGWVETQRKRAPTPVVHERLWADLAGDAVVAYQAVETLADTPVQTVAFLKARLRPVQPVEPRHLQRLLADLDDQKFAVRNKAEQSLEALGDLAAGAIKERLAQSPSLEMKRRLDRLMKKLDAREVTSDVLQVLRAIETLDMIDTAEARSVLAGLAKGAPGHRITEDARTTLERLVKKTAGPSR
jgi:WD40 repeat protein